MTELATRIDRDLRYPIRRDERLQCGLRCEVYRADGVVLEYLHTHVPATAVPARLRVLALSIELRTRPGQVRMTVARD
ncbi:hypothetical protein ACQP2U_23740 [Nocardia sp. CA-084685]|uniref:hypothetical protein n=1 Tax=Nocardia sp. CA-084685 TaxID=3239970 RepID=UPI003D970ACC